MFLVLLSCIVNLSLGRLSNGTQLGGWTDINNLNDPKIQAIAKFALEEGSKQMKGLNLSFVSVAEGKQRTVSGYAYKLIIVASSGSNQSKYEAEIWVQPWKKFQKLIYFTLTNNKV
uniref:Cystatin domain-containing protein n=1 Tax=Kalanchoe fedtschenkoi TaxID=63787 RepID=A0A7N0UQH7_KALFE